MPKILVTNDDGLGAPGLSALAKALEPLGEIWVAAPNAEKSGASRAITIHEPIRADPMGERTWIVQGTPSDCVMLALNELLGFRPDAVLSGINPGPNLGENIFYSGTVAGAAEAAKYGIPGIAVSVNARHGIDYSAACELALKVTRRALAGGLPPGTALNVNVPHPAYRGVRITHQSSKISRNFFKASQDPRGRPYYWMDEEVPWEDAEAGSDYEAIRDGYASVTPMRFDPTVYEWLATARSWLMREEK